MSDPDFPSTDDDRGPRWALIIVSVLVVVGAAIAALALFGGDDDDASSGTISALPGTATAASTIPATTTPTTTPTTEAPDPTVAPTTAAPATTAAPTTTAPAAFEFTIDGIDDEGEIPVEFTCDGDDTPPVVTIESSPDGTLELAFIVDDPDAPTDDPFVHWVVYGIAGNTSEFTDGEDAISYGVNDADTEGWIGPCPPDGEHEYVFTLFALDEELGLEPGLNGRELAEAIADATIDETEITATYERQG